MWYNHPKTQTSAILLVFDDFLHKPHFLVLSKTLYTGYEAELLRERESSAEIETRLSHQYKCNLSVVSTWSVYEQKFPRLCNLN